MALHMLTTRDDYCIFIMEGRRIFGIRDGKKRIVPLPQRFRLGNCISNKASVGNLLMPCKLDVFTGILKFKVVALLQILGRLLSPSELRSEEVNKANKKLFCKIILGMCLLLELFPKLFKTWKLLGTVVCLPPDKPPYGDASQRLLSARMEYAFSTFLE